MTDTSSNAIASFAQTYERKLPAPKDYAATLSAQERAGIHKSAQSFEAMYMSEMMNYMFKDTDLSQNMFGGGAGESMYNSLMVNEYANQFTKSGQAMITPTLEREMLKFQALQKNPHLNDLPAAQTPPAQL